MKRDPAPHEVAVRLSQLRALHVSERLEDAHRRLARERPQTIEPFERTVARSLAELRALYDSHATYSEKADPWLPKPATQAG